MTNNDELSSIQAVLVLTRQWKVLLASVITTSMVAVAAIVTTEPIYRVEALVKPVDTFSGASALSSALGSLGGIGALAGLAIGGSSGDVATEAIAVLRSRKFVKEFLDKNQIVPELFSEQWDQEKGAWKSTIVAAPSGAAAYGYFVGEVFDAFRDQRTGFVKIRVDWKDRVQAATWANGVVDLLNETMRVEAIVEAEDTIRYLDEEYNRTDSVAVRAAISSMMESQMKLKMMAAVRKQYTFEFLDPAVTPDVGAVLRPRPVLYMVVAVVVGTFVGCAIALVRNGSRN